MKTTDPLFSKLSIFAASLLMASLMASGGALANEPVTTSSGSSQDSMSQNCDDELKDANGECPSDTLQNDAPTTGGQEGSSTSSGTSGTAGDTGDAGGDSDGGDSN